jgi:hypothetical protein
VHNPAPKHSTPEVMHAGECVYKHQGRVESVSARRTPRGWIKVLLMHSSVSASLLHAQIADKDHALRPATREALWNGNTHRQTRRYLRFATNNLQQLTKEADLTYLAWPKLPTLPSACINTPTRSPPRLLIPTAKGS